ncbi:tetratricopeptide repeat protein [Novosphingobium sp. FSY-8]|uniref:Tetratricopeptide repeat protein n=1 Tax=Novosphingobium ovatum TaxID=1908523 RepID=A0ABW9X9E5_9SPHN|nr:SPOR domain-containing protein [Novosphingobium ovatum]NBC35135.1 tetratricopeptide repeat protein [Novosphingobium ovatum]
MTAKCFIPHRRPARSGLLLPLASSAGLALALMAMGAPVSAQAAAGGAGTTLTGGAADAAVAMAESAVQASPRDVATRVALGRAYLKAGRYQSAETALSDAMTLGDTSGRTLLMLSLAEVASGHSSDAIALLDRAKADVPAADLGLALALAGEPGRGVAVLLDAVRAGERSDKLRANLAYAYALDGKWGEARNLVAMDLPAAQVDARMTEWAQLARPEAAKDRVAQLLGVPAREDAGMPVALALSGQQNGVQLAAAAPEPAPMPAAVAQPVPAAELPATVEPVAPAPMMAAAPAPVFQPVPLKAAPAPVAAKRLAKANAKLGPKTGKTKPKPDAALADAAPVDAAPAAIAPKPVRVAAKTRPMRVAMANVALATKPVSAKPAPAAAGDSGAHAVQLGSFSSAANAERARATFAQRDADLRGREIVIAKAVVNGRNFWRVQVKGYTAVAAAQKCGTVQKKGAVCMAFAAGSLPGETGPALASR